MKRLPLYLSVFAITAISCNNTSTNQDASSTPSIDSSKTEAIDSVHIQFVEQILEDRKHREEKWHSSKIGKFYSKNEKRFLSGGEDSSTHFDVSNLDLEENQFHYGIGRESFHALLSPEFISIEVADTGYTDTDRFLIATVNGESKAYGLDLLEEHEIINDSLGGQAIMPAYCHLADLGAVYSRTYQEHTLTFALSGYTYYDDSVWDGMDGFILWDRETESLWWPLTGAANSGSLKGTKLQVLPSENWAQLTWKEVKESYSHALVLAPGQTMEAPSEWPKLDIQHPLTVQEDNSLAPKWGDEK